MRDLKEIMKMAEFIEDHTTMKSYFDSSLILFTYFEKEKIFSPLEKQALVKWYSKAFYIINYLKFLNSQERRFFELFQSLDMSWKEFKKTYSEHIQVEFSENLALTCREWSDFREGEKQRENDNIRG